MLQRRRPSLSAAAEAAGAARVCCLTTWRCSAATIKRLRAHEIRVARGNDPNVFWRHLAHHRQRPAGHRHACRSPTWGSPTRRLLEALLPSISTSVLRALQRAQQLRGGPRNRLGSSRFRLPGHCSNRCLRTQLHLPKADHTVREAPAHPPEPGAGRPRAAIASWFGNDAACCGACCVRCCCPWRRCQHPEVAPDVQHVAEHDHNAGEWLRDR